MPAMARPPGRLVALGLEYFRVDLQFFQPRHRRGKSPLASDRADVGIVQEENRALGIGAVGAATSPQAVDRLAHRVAATAGPGQHGREHVGLAVLRRRGLDVAAGVPRLPRVERATGLREDLRVARVGMMDFLLDRRLHRLQQVLEVVAVPQGLEVVVAGHLVDVQESDADGPFQFHHRLVGFAQLRQHAGVVVEQQRALGPFLEHVRQQGVGGREIARLGLVPHDHQQLGDLGAELIRLLLPPCVAVGVHRQVVGVLGHRLPVEVGQPGRGGVLELDPLRQFHRADVGRELYRPGQVGRVDDVVDLARELAVAKGVQDRLQHLVAEEIDVHHAEVGRLAQRHVHHVVGRDVPEADELVGHRLRGPAIRVDHHRDVFRPASGQCQPGRHPRHHGHKRHHRQSREAIHENSIGRTTQSLRDSLRAASNAQTPRLI